MTAGVTPAAPAAPGGARRAGLLLPLFSCHSRTGWGIGEYADVPALAVWMRDAGLSLLQLLPLNEMAPGQTSPYSALSSMALDPIFLRVPDVPDFVAMGGEPALDTALRGMLAHVRGKTYVDYWAVRTLKDRTLRMAFRHFLEHEWTRQTPRAAELKAFIEQEGWWLDDYAVFRAVLHASDGQSWRRWPTDLAAHKRGAVERVRRELSRDVLFRQYLQWLAHTQWTAARRAAEGVLICGDVPFMVAADSADAWANQACFSFDGTAGAPPDAFSAQGQNWGLPIYRWDVLREREYDWFVGRARRMAALFDGFRVDHVVGLFRTWVFPHDDRKPYFTPPDELTQLVQGQAVLRAFQQGDVMVIAEDLGTIPDFVRNALAPLGIPGYKVIRWERFWNDPGQPFVDPVAFPALSLATTGTHDTETAAQWWSEATHDERVRLLALPSLAGLVQEHALTPDSPFVPDVRDALLELLLASGSNLAVIPLQDVFGWTDRVNVPAVVDDTNWTWKLPWPVDALAVEPTASERRDTLARWARRYGRMKGTGEESGIGGPPQPPTPGP